MSFVAKLPLLGRNPAVCFSLLPSSRRCASRLSAIHQGLNRSERARPQGSSPRKEIRQGPNDDPYLSPAERRRARAIARQQDPINYKIRKGKKDITEEPGPPRKSKRARFNDPRDPMGERSLVKKFRTGQLFDGLDEGYGGDKEGNLQHDDFVRQMSGDAQDRSGPRNRGREPRSGPPRKFGNSQRSGTFERNTGVRESRPWREQESREKFKSGSGMRDQRRDKRETEDTYNNSFDRRAPDSRVPSDSPRRDQRAATAYGSEGTRQFGSSGRDRRPRSSYGSERTRPAEPRSDDAGNAKAWKPKRNDGPVSIPYATAASQFLYGTSAVEAALKAGRRKLYKLYIYRGKGRGSRTSEKDTMLGDLARRKGVKVEYLEEESLPMLNKMSESRPHNGHVLEASPLPQLPTTGLEEFSEDQDQTGFKVAVGHQSYEETQVNGTNGFVRTEPSSRKPLVMVVDQVLDPGNLGAILRTASFMGVTAVAVSKKGSAPVTPVVLKASAGAAEDLNMLSVDSVEDFLQNSKENGWKVYAACPPKSESKQLQIDTIDLERDDPLLKDPCILLVGSEGEGLSRSLRRVANVEVSIPNLSGSDVVDSLNVSVATGLLCSAFLRGKAKARGSSASDPGALF
ncbi:hypothetical protein N8I77_002602 [Diaporthe amygdali]|uniref:rRNA methyltransferase 1, mitochondrial n=1 Tax=Phomopsis amygdali TaxID=1214568 RepID=A0AAD9SUL3_PHOAM|nr:hypothetical protein N8I77_002602 [Diaporthe amygdali]